MVKPSATVSVLDDHRSAGVRSENSDTQEYPKSLKGGSATFKRSSEFFAQFFGALNVQTHNAVRRKQEVGSHLSCRVPPLTTPHYTCTDRERTSLKNE